jgi:hypothetical protein
VFPVRYELNLYILCRRQSTASVVEWSEFLATQRRCVVLPVRYELNLYVYNVDESRPHLWSSGQNSRLQNGDLLCFL